MSLNSDVARVRAFNRFYTSHIGLLVERPFGGDFSLTETRVLYELAHRDRVQPKALSRELRLDPAYLSRILARFRRRGLIEQRQSEEDRRGVLISITPAGRAAFAPLDQASSRTTATLLRALPARARRALVDAVSCIEQALGPQQNADSRILHRDMSVGDMGWIVHRQGLLYAEEYGWDATYEALVAEILSQFVRGFDPAREQSWIAEREGEIVGSVFLMKTNDPKVGKLRLLYVEPWMRGQGLGAALVTKCIEGARGRGYRTLELWTNDVLASARRIYQAAGFTLIAEEPHRSFRRDLVGQTWRLEL